jgi:hypothetical protein
MKLSLADSSSLPSHEHGRIYEVLWNFAFRIGNGGTRCRAKTPYARRLRHTYGAFACHSSRKSSYCIAVGMVFDCTLREGHVMRYCVKLSGSAVIESSRLVAITDRLTYACKMLPPSEITTCRSLCVKCLLDRALHLCQTRLPGLLSSHMVVESPSVSAVSQKCAEQYSRAMSNEKRPPIPLLPKQPDSRFESRMYIIDPQLRESSVTSESSLKRVQVQAACVPCHKRKTRVCQRVSYGKGAWTLHNPMAFLKMTRNFGGRMLIS